MSNKEMRREAFVRGVAEVLIFLGACCLLGLGTPVPVQSFSAQIASPDDPKREGPTWWLLELQPALEAKRVTPHATQVGVRLLAVKELCCQCFGHTGERTYRHMAQPQ